ncbi:noelin-2b isoform X2 [Sinocyclocheilus anshuiensis]|uniref:noelin-2b isoform X1 n=1 Tax=Sinocyclocheilus anshuiensis TaxID=1608454 RepID=UPI0007B931BF|nr:PREDICTED: noelin-2-like isoform X1 [Sinocyclocheilus anshuiensis]XP_016336957.1 PREDICTED: noelin-2-like isoform X2 [Sinocyclocheilus anshuiensis]
MSAPLLKVGAVLSTMILVTNWMSQTLPGLVGLDPHIARPGTSEKIISQVSYPGEDEGWQVYGSVQGKCVCSIMTPAHGVCGGDPRHARLQLISDQLLNVSQHMEILSQRTTQDLQQLRDSETLLETLERILNTVHEEPHSLTSKSLQELRGRVSQCRPLRALVGRLRADVGHLEALKEEMQRLNDSLSILQERFTLHHYQQLQQREFILQRHLHSCSSQLGCGLLTGISAPLTIRSSGSRFGSWMMDSLIDSTDNRVWVMDGYFKGRRLVEYQSLGDFATGQNFIVHHLPHPWAGTGHVVYNSSLYYNKHHSNVLVRYDLASGGVLQQRPLAQAGFNNTFPYSWGGSSDIDLMADETGLWAVYSSIGRGGNMLLSRLHPDTLEVLHSWDTGFSKRSAGEAFLICGSLYVTNSHLAGAKVHFTFHTASASYEYTDIAFHNQYSHISMLDYNPRIRALYTWNNGHQVLYDITLLHFIRTRHANSTD